MVCIFALLPETFKAIFWLEALIYVDYKSQAYFHFSTTASSLSCKFSNQQKLTRKHNVHCISPFAYSKHNLGRNLHVFTENLMFFVPSGDQHYDESSSPTSTVDVLPCFFATETNRTTRK